MTASLVFGFVAVLWTVGLIGAPANSPMRMRLNSLFPLMVFLVFIVVFAVNANADVLDRLIYTSELKAVAGKSLSEAFGTGWSVAREPMYIFFLWIVSFGGDSTVWLYLCVGVACAAVYVISFTKLFSWWQAPLMLLTAASFGILTGYASLVIRQGLSMALLFAAVCLILAGRRQRWWIALLISAALFHWSAAPAAILIAVVALFRIRLRWALVIWGSAAVLFMSGLNALLLRPIAAFVPQIDSYSNESLIYAYSGGVSRLDFMIFSAAVLAFGLLALRFGETPNWYSKLIILYVLLNVYFLIFGFISYSDRLAAYSWSLAPLLFAAPFADPKTLLGRLAMAGFVMGVLVLGIFRSSFLAIVGLVPF